MPRDCACGADSDNASAIEALDCTHQRQRRCRSSRRESASGHDLREENLWLAQQLAISEANARRWQERVQILRHQAQQHTSERVQWQRTATRNERQWTREYDHHMRSLMQIIAHHEETHRAMRAEMEQLKASVRRVERSTQTDVVGEITQVMSHGNCGSVGHVCAPMQTPASGVEEPDDTSLEQVEHETAAFTEASRFIHEQYVALTMQKLLEQIRQNLSPPHHTPPSPPLTAPSSFRESIRRRLLDATASVDTNPISNANEVLKIGGVRGAGTPELPVLHEQDIYDDTPSISPHHFMSPSAA